MSVSSSTDDLELLTFRLRDQEYALDIMSVREIRGWTHATSLPHAPDYMKGVINLRGTVLPVMDLACRLGLQNAEKNHRNVIIVVKSEGVMTGLLVDAVSDIITVSETDVQPPPEVSSNQPQSVLRALTLVEDRMIRILNLQKTLGKIECAEA